MESVIGYVRILFLKRQISYLRFFAAKSAILDFLTCFLPISQLFEVGFRHDWSYLKDLVKAMLGKEILTILVQCDPIYLQKCLILRECEALQWLNGCSNQKNL